MKHQKNVGAYYMSKLCLVIFVFFSIALNAQGSDRVIVKTKKECLSDLTYSEIHSLFTVQDDDFPKHLVQFRCIPKSQKAALSFHRLSQERDAIIHIPLGPSQTKLDHIISGKGFLPGEEITLTLTNEDGTYSEHCSFIPNPLIKTSDDNKLSVEARLVALEPIITYILILKGFEKNTLVKFRSESNKETLNTALCITNDPTNISYCPSVRGDKGGEGKVTFTDLRNHQVELKLPWGNELDKYLKEKK